MKRLVMILLLLSVFGMSLPAVLFAAGSADVVEQMSKVSLNAGSVSDLQVLPGVGAVTAERIVAYREKNGPYATVDALLNVKGIGVKTLEKMSPMLEL
jgi:competence protein ComEA